MNEFEPSREGAATLDERMRTRLAESISYILAEVGEDLGIDRESGSALVADIRSRPQAPQRFGIYYDLVLAIDREDRDQARSLARELSAPRPSAAFSITALQDRPAEESDRYARLLLSNREIARPINPEQFADGKARISDALALLEAGFPEVAEEIQVLLREIVVATASQTPGEIGFSAASSYMLWGAMLFNALEPLSRLDIAQSLAHESGHNLLFGLCTDGPLVDNPDDEYYGSPLRADPRPMDGVVHATYIIARMHLTVQRLLASGALTAEEQAAAEVDLATHVRNFAKGDDTVRGGARLTAIGERVMADARVHMARAPALQD